MARHMLTTLDNPYNPFTHWDEWEVYDFTKGYNTSGLLARFTISSDELSEPDQELAIDQAIDEILFFNPTGLHIRVTHPDDSD